MNLTRMLAIEQGQPAEYRWVAEHTTEPKFVLDRGVPLPTLFAAYESQIGQNWHQAYEAVFYERRSESDDFGSGDWWRLTTSDAIYIMQHETVMVEAV